jgi:hypothetical protein
VPTATEAELAKRRGKRPAGAEAPSPRHRGRAARQGRDLKVLREPGDKGKNGKQVTVAVAYTLLKSGDRLLGPRNRLIYTSIGPKRLAFEWARKEAIRRGFAPGTTARVQILTDGDPDLARAVAEYFGVQEYPGRLHTLDLMHVREYLNAAARAQFSSPTRRRKWVALQDQRLLAGHADKVLHELDKRLEGKAMKASRRSRRKAVLTTVRSYIGSRLPMLDYLRCQREDLELASGQVEGAVRNVVRQRCDQSGMRWIAARVQAVLQLRAIHVNRHWDAFVSWAIDRLRSEAATTAKPQRLQPPRHQGTQAPHASPDGG